MLLRYWLLSMFIGMACILSMTNGFGILSKKIFKKGFLAGAAAGALVAGGTAAAIAVAIDEKNNKEVYNPPLGSMLGQLVVITGGSTGLGLESAKRLTAAGATVVITSRTKEKGEKAVQDVHDYVKNFAANTAFPEEVGSVSFAILDLDDLDTVKQFPSELVKQLGNTNVEISVLLNNAGVMAIPDRQLTINGNERTFQSNHLGHFVLTAALFPYFSRNKCTVINVSSDAYKIAKNGLDLNNLNGESSYGAWSSYGLSKLCNILFTKELQRRADEANMDWLTAVSLHPGAVSTDLGRYLFGKGPLNQLESLSTLNQYISRAIETAVSLVTKTVQDGASTHVYLASGAEGKLEKGAYYSDCRVTKVRDYAMNVKKAKALWSKSEELGGINFNLEFEETDNNDVIDISSSTTTTTTDEADSN